MSLRRCPACRNQVERESETCPVCGRTFAQAITLRIIPWAGVSLLLLWFVHHLKTLHPH
ncbi:MAG TPA: hypothetical protein VHS31_01565 [Tepidisphaeraceae bacterium]|jgi:RNA polymerase subunit RPABC4/transcription elongation factor Spt4|nr:hypothetical protein [Tepidisphaeraceae bacterium]